MLYQSNRRTEENKEINRNEEVYISVGTKRELLRSIFGIVVFEG